MTRILLATCAALSLAACSTNDGSMSNMSASQPASSSSASANMMPTERVAYVTMAGASDLYEIQSSQLALQKAQDSGVREFAQMMITHHTQTTQQVTAAARQSGMTPPPPQLTAQQAQMISQLQAASGAEFDRLYKQQQVQAHEMALALHRTYADDGDTEELRRVARSAVPIVQDHLTRVRKMAG